MIDILLAVYNGERYLKEQLDSLLRQTNADWHITARDDGSTDSSARLLEAFAAEHPQKMKIIEDDQKNLGSKGNFSRLLAVSDAEYIMFCDQDDVWLPDKIENTLELMRATERGGPALVHTDLCVADSELKTISASFVNAHNIDPLPCTAAGLMYRNSVTGCTVMLNRQLAALAGSIPDECLMHDHWLALLALTFGRLGYLDEATILYRQHGENTVGFNKKGLMRKLRTALDISGYKAALKRTGAETERNAVQIRAFYEKYAKDMDEQNKALFEDFLNMKSFGRLKRLKVLKRGGYLPCGKYERTALKAYYLLVK